MIFQTDAEILAGNQQAFTNFEPYSMLFFIIMFTAIVFHRFVWTKLKRTVERYQEH